MASDTAENRSYDMLSLHLQDELNKLQDHLSLETLNASQTFLRSAIISRIPEPRELTCDLMDPDSIYFEWSVASLPPDPKDLVSPSGGNWSDESCTILCWVRNDSKWIIYTDLFIEQFDGSTQTAIRRLQCLFKQQPTDTNKR